MSTSSSSKRRQFWRADWVVGACIVAALAVLWMSDVFAPLEMRFYDVASTRSPRQASDRIAVVTIDDQNIANTGRWPWQRDVQAELIDKLSAAKGTTVVYTTFFCEPQVDRGLVFIRKIKEALDSACAESVDTALFSLASAARARAEAERTSVIAAAGSGAPLDGGVAVTSYDPPAKAAAADDPFARTAVFGRPGGPAHPKGGEGQPGSEA